MFWLGLIAIASPIIIHLLNRRRFKIVEWAAMEFLLNASKKNRRRIQLENIILLVLRCIAIFLVGLLLARPFFPNDIKLFGEDKQFERIVLLDDSFSMNVRTGNKTIFESAKEKLKEFVKNLVRDKSANLLTLILASDVDHPVLSKLEVSPDTETEIYDAIDEIRCSDFPATYSDNLRAIVDETAGQQKGINRVFYLMTDLREQDWWNASQSEEGNPAQNYLKDIGNNTPLGCYVVDLGDENDVNIAVTDLQPRSTLKSGVSNSFFVTVTNFGSATVKNVRLDFYSSETSVAQSEFIDSLEPGESNSVTKSFPVTFELESPEGFEDSDQIANESGYWKVWAEVVAPDSASDLVSLDSKRFYAAKVKRGTSVLLVDGDPSAIQDRSETYYLRRALRPVESDSGIIPTIVGVTELSSVDFSKYQIVYLCNVDELSEGQLDSLERWVAGGGNLVFMLGDQINESIYNKQFYFSSDKAKKNAEAKSVSEVRRLLGGAGLSPVKLKSMDGDVNQETWVNMDLGEVKSQVTAVFEGQGNIAVSLVNFYSWWTSTQPGFDPVLDSGSNVLQAGKHYKFGSSHTKSKVYSTEVADSTELERFRMFEVNSKALEVGAEFVISDVMGNFEKYPIRLTTDSDAKFSFAGKVSAEMTLGQLPTPASNEVNRFGCWKFRYSNGDVWTVTAERPENVEDKGENTKVLARFNDEASNPAIVEKRFGEGRVIAFTFPADEDWTNLPQIGSANLLLHMEMCDYLADSESLETSKVGEPAEETIDISRFKQNSTMVPPIGEKRNLTAVQSVGASNGVSGKYWTVGYPRMEKSGFYEMVLTQQEKEDGKDVTQSRIFAANVDPVEGNLRRLDFDKVGKEYFGPKVKVIAGPKMTSQTVQGARTEYWIYILFLLGGILIIEQFLGWLFGRRR